MNRRGSLVAAGGGIALVALLTFAGWWVESASDAVGGAWFDSRIAMWASRSIPGWLDPLMRVVTWGGASPLVLSALLIGSMVVRKRGESAVALHLVLCSIGLLLSNVVKQIVDRPRPAIAPLVEAGGSAFPSGHTTAGTILFIGGAIAIARLRLGLSRWAVWMLGCSGALLVGFSRIALGVHWTTDVIGGWVLGGAWAAVAWRASSHLPEAAPTMENHG